MTADGPVQIHSLRVAGLPAAIRLLLPLAEPARKNRKLPVDHVVACSAGVDGRTRATISPGIVEPSGQQSGNSLK